MSTTDQIEEYKQAAKADILRNCIPFYQRWINSTARHLKLPAFLVPLVFSAIPYLLGLLIAMFSSRDTENYSVFWLRANASGIIAGIFYFMSYIHTKTMSYTDEFLFILTGKEQVDILRQCYRLMFKSPFQRVHNIFWGVVTVLTVSFLGIPLSRINSIYFGAVVFMIGFMLGAGVWYTITISVMIRNFCRFEKIRLNLFNPSRTVGIKELANLCSMWSICLVLEGVLIIVGLYCANWSHGENVTYYFHVFWTVYLSLLTLYMFIYPHVEIKKIIDMGKKKGAQVYQSQIEIFLSKYGHHTADELEKMEKELGILSQYHNIYLSIIKSPSLAIDLSIVGRFLSALFVPLVITMIQRPDYLRSIYLFFKNVFS